MFNLNVDEKNHTILDHIQLAKSLSMKFPNLPYEDRFQEACLGLINAYHNYESNRNVSFGSYAKIVIINQLRQYYKKEKMRLLFIAKNNDEKSQEDNYIQESISYNCYNYFELKEDLQKHFGDFKIKILIEISNGKTQEECSHIFGISQSSISRVIKQIREYMEEE